VDLLALLTLNRSQIDKLNPMSSLSEHRQAVEDVVATTPNRSLQLDIRKALVDIAAVSIKHHRLKQEPRQVVPTDQELHQHQLTPVRLLLVATNVILIALATALDTVVATKALLVFAGL
jgi:hypothetical protein